MFYQFPNEVKNRALKSQIRLVCSLMLAVTTCLWLHSEPVYAADHIDGPAATSDPAADLADIYVWMQNSNAVNLVMTVFPNANAESRFSDSVQYVFRIESQSGYQSVDQSNTLVCTFTVAQAVTCELNGNPIVSGVDASSTTGVTNADGTFRIFTGLRNDPFFFDSTNFNVVRRTVRDAAGSLSFDEAGCPTLDETTKSVLVSTLTGNGGLPGANSPAANFFGPFDSLAIVIQADRNLFGPGPLYAVSGSTHRAP